MPYQLNISEGAVFGKKMFANAKGNTECVEFVQQATGAPHTASWKKGVNVMESPMGSIRRGTAIATFDENGRYPSDAHGRHAAIYLSHNEVGIVVLDQWNGQGEVKQRTIFFNRPDLPRMNSAKNYYVIQ
jgi:hypothetical protein